MDRAEVLATIEKNDIQALLDQDNLIKSFDA